MTETATSPRYHRPAAPRNSSTKSTSAIPTMSDYLSARIATPNPQSNPKTPSPNYFGSHENSSFLSGSSELHAKKNWSPPSSVVRSTAAASPSIIPLDQNPDLDAFRRQSEGKAFNLGGLGGTFKMNTPPVKSKHKHGRSSSSSGDDVSPVDAKKSATPRSRKTSETDHSPGDMPRSPKRVLSPSAVQQRRMSPASFEKNEAARPQSQPRFQLPLDNMVASYGKSKVHRAETLPESGVNDQEPSLFVTPQHVITLIGSQSEDMLLLDLRVSTQYAESHIAGALNLCVPTTLLKRTSFNVQKLTETFKDDDQRSKFVKWRNSQYIVVYDASSAQLKDAQICVNMIKKFESEGYEGSCYIVKGGFNEFSRRFPDQIASGVSPNGFSSSDDGPDVAPVIGGCPMPATDKPANPFFGNIRQNMDLIGGVGQIPLQHPDTSRSSDEADYPEWLSKAAASMDQGKQVSRKFEQIERREKKRMEDALSGQVSWEDNSPSPKQNVQISQSPGGVQIAGIEKGNKNRYNNIWPFEHSRVKLQGLPKNDCDYFNANFIQASWSHKRYISTQAPIPATFNDFWNVVWQQDVRVIVMLTAEKEGAQVKAHNYWDQKKYGPLQLDFLSEKRASLEPERIHNSKSQKKKRPDAMKRASTLSATGALAGLDPTENKKLSSKDEGGKVASSTGEQPYVIVRRFTLSHSKKPFEPMREITQLQYSSWPDFGAPAHPTHLLGLVEQTEAVVRASNGGGVSQPSARPAPGRRHTGDPEPAGTRPVLVHCSAGCGRTGTFCTVDSVIDMLKRQRISTPTGPTAMEIDQPAKKDSGDPNGFFASQSLDSSQQSDQGGPEGQWISRQDLDLVEKTVEDFRHQRLSMVQSLRQYVLCYESVMEWLVEQHKEQRRNSVAA